MIINSSNALHKRTERIFFLYRNYLFSKSLNDSDQEIFSKEYSFDEEQISFINDIIANIDTLETKIKEFIPESWTLERFNYIEKAILLNGISEIIIAKNKLEIVIDESLNFAKKYSSSEASPLINAILDKIGKDKNDSFLSKLVFKKIGK